VVINGEMKVAFALYPVSMKQIIDIADTGNIMPPKTTWFEPKLRSGLVIHELSAAPLFLRSIPLDVFSPQHTSKPVCIRLGENVLSTPTHAKRKHL